VISYSLSYLICHRQTVTRLFNLLFSGLNYSVFGLGNKTYEHYNACGIYVDKRLTELGGNRIHVLGLGDDDANLEDDFITWKEAFWASACNSLELEVVGDDFSMRQYELKVLEEGDYKTEKLYTGEPARLRSLQTQRPPFDVKNPYMSTIKVNKNLHSDQSDRLCMHIEFDIANSRIRYDAGDHIAIYPQNDLTLVNRIGELLNLDLDTVFTMINLDEDSSKRHPFPCPTTYRTALSYYVDITALPRTHIMKELAEYTTDAAEKEKLLLMVTTTPEGKEMYQKWVQDSCRHITHILEDLPHCKPNIDHIMELLPRLQPRFYSISSSSRLHSEDVHVTAVVVEYETKTGRKNHGVATTWLKPMIPAEETQFKAPVYVRRSQFRLPNRPQTPVIMVGPGTGLAPFRGFIQERKWQKEQGKPVGETHLFFGCRNENIDYIYRDELEAFAEEGLLSLHTAFSRDQAQKVYVTHRLRENAETVWRVIGENNGHFYVCGDAGRMAKEVHTIVEEIVAEHGKMSKEDAEAYVKKMEQQKRYSADVWS
jgi:NADPH-ferrihemoprotein reductase